MPVLSSAGNAGSKSVRNYGIVPISAAKHGVWLIVTFFSFIPMDLNHVSRCQVQITVIVLFCSYFFLYYVCFYVRVNKDEYINYLQYKNEFTVPIKRCQYEVPLHYCL